KRMSIEPILVGRNEAKLRHLAETVADREIGQSVPWTTDLQSVLSDDGVDIVFDASSTLQRSSVVRQAAEHGKAIYCEKPIATQASEALELAQLVEAQGLKNGVVQDKLWLPGMRKLRMLRDQGFFGRI